MGAILPGHTYELRGETGSPIPEPLLMYTRGLVAQLTAFDHAVGPESYPLTALCSTICTLDVGFMGCTTLPLVPTLAQMRRKPEGLAGLLTGYTARKRSSRAQWILRRWDSHN